MQIVTYKKKVHVRQHTGGVHTNKKHKTKNREDQSLLKCYMTFQEILDL
jgi:hypothetical protein